MDNNQDHLNLNPKATVILDGNTFDLSVPLERGEKFLLTYHDVQKSNMVHEYVINPEDNTMTYCLYQNKSGSDVDAGDPIYLVRAVMDSNGNYECKLNDVYPYVAKETFQDPKLNEIFERRYLIENDLYHNSSTGPLINGITRLYSCPKVEQQGKVITSPPRYLGEVSYVKALSDPVALPLPMNAPNDLFTDAFTSENSLVNRDITYDQLLRERGKLFSMQEILHIVKEYDPKVKVYEFDRNAA